MIYMEKIVPDTSVIISGILSDLVQKNELTKIEVILPEFVVEELRAQASKGREIGFKGLGSFFKVARIGSQAHRGPLVMNRFLLFHERDHWMGALGIEFDAVGIFQVADISCDFDDSKLHAKTDAKEGDFLFAGKTDRPDFSLDATLPETAGNNHTVKIF